MRLCIENFAKIKSANIVIDGITVITGENNTGKSTVGKILFSLFNSLENIEDKIADERLKEISSTNRRILNDYISASGVPKSIVLSKVRSTAQAIMRRLKKRMEKDEEISEQEIRKCVVNAIKMWGNSADPVKLSEWTEMIEELIENIHEIFGMPENVIILEVITRYFDGVFHSQINSLSHAQAMDTMLNLEIKGKSNVLAFRNNACAGVKNAVNIIHNAIYIDNPLILDELSGFNDLNPMQDFLREVLVGEPKDGIMDGVIETIRVREKLSGIYDTLQKIVDGQIIMNQEDEFYLKNDEFQEPISLHNLSTGLKSFVILKMLLERGGLREKDVLILDEPEIHLHPQWQVAYAEIIVLLQKQFDLSIVVTTHSPYFLDAINLFSCKYDIDSRTNYYLSSLNENGIAIQDVTGQMDLIYKKMASPIQMLDSLRYELNNR